MLRFVALAVLAFLLFLIVRASIHAFLRGLRGGGRSKPQMRAGAGRAGQGSHLRDLHPAPQGDRPRQRSGAPVFLQREPAPTSTPRVRERIGRRGQAQAEGPGRSGQGRWPLAADPYHAIDRQTDPTQFARILEARGKQPNQARLRRAFLSLATVKAGMRVLDVGCGTGVVTRDIAARVGIRGAVTGVDPSRALLAVARRRARADPVYP